jgi:hypothetical protein
MQRNEEHNFVLEEEKSDDEDPANFGHRRLQQQRRVLFVQGQSI